MKTEPSVETPLKIGVSRCLLGDPVRYNGGHSLDRYVRDTLGRFMEFVPVCPEVECGMPTPRESLRLVGDPRQPRLVTRNSGIDWTDIMTEWGERRIEALKTENLCGFIFKSKSPSSGMARVKVYTKEGMPSNRGRGLFAGMFMDAFPLLPVEDEGRLQDPGLRSHFIDRIFALKRWRDHLKSPKTVGNLVRFHTGHKLMFMGHSPEMYRLMGKHVAEAAGMPVETAYGEYEALLLKALDRKCTRKKHANVLMHMMGYFKKMLDSDDKEELLTLVDQYRTGRIPLVVPLTLLKHYTRKFGVDYLAGQTYLQPHPEELFLRNHI